MIFKATNFRYRAVRHHLQQQLNDKTNSFVNNKCLHFLFPGVEARRDMKYFVSRRIPCYERKWMGFEKKRLSILNLS